MLLDEYIEIVVDGHTLEYYREKGYDVPTYIDKRYNKERVKKGTKIIIKTEDLTHGSHQKVRVRCDNCGKETSPTFQNYLKSISSGNDGKYYCHKCSAIHNRQTNLEKYSVETPRQNKDINDKAIKTNIQRYGGNSPSISKEVIEKIKQINLEKYGIGCILELPEHIESRKRVSLEKFGTEIPTQSSICLELIKKTNLKKYGTEWAIASPQVREKIYNSFTKNGTMKSSNQQEYLNNLYNGQLNHQISHFFVDIFVEKDNICCEYDGGGHNLNVVTGRWSQEEYDRREIIRESTLRGMGHRILRIISTKDILPSDEILLQMYSESLFYFNTTNHTWRIYDIDKGIFIDAEHKDGESYDFGNLRKIHKQSA